MVVGAATTAPTPEAAWETEQRPPQSRSDSSHTAPLHELFADNAFFAYNPIQSERMTFPLR